MRGIFQRPELNAIQDLAMRILFRQNNIEKMKEKSETRSIDNEFFWVKIAAMGYLKPDRRGQLRPAYDPKKLFPEYFASAREQEAIERQRQEKEDTQNIEWKTPSDAMDDWEKTQRLLAQYSNIAVVDRTPMEDDEEEPLTEPLGPPEGVGEPPSMDQPFSGDDLEWM